MKKIKFISLSNMERKSMKKLRPDIIINHKSMLYLPSVSVYASNYKDFNLVLEEARALANIHLSERQRKYLFSPIDELIGRSSIEKLSYPIGVFLSESLNGYVSLPFEVDPLAVVANSFHLKPLLKLVQREHPFMVLFFTKREAVLFRGSSTELREVEHMRYATLREVGDVTTAIDRSVYRLSQNAATPLILAGDYDYASFFKNETLFPRVVDEIIVEVAERTQKNKLHLECIRVLEPYLAKQEEKLIKQFEASERKGLTTSNLNEIMDNAIRKKVRHIFISESENIWGSVNPIDGRPTYSPKVANCVDDILDDLAELVLKNGGGVTVLAPEKMPNGRSACAIFV